ncbi:hypothetical protein J2S49_001548 [Arcanobacterium wilhelmae]|uniref:Peptidase C39-like domain-containing protein n=1 Tax=Arcanobacterium wilhelmae TaxID=1803177 RepID=A0ABT9NCN1_9ACTO|nr:hypothetical protein [Arcanobacterium wilhelmae]MDP9801472.1 hypothetical protein [Arcanobacterium wilhelmae]WFN90803.1 hypothetical protein P8A24_02810 [Arcanobacterium wilhelmae]
MKPYEISAPVWESMETYAAHGEPLEAGGHTLRQSTPTTCGAMALLVARAYLRDDLREQLEEHPGFASEIEAELYGALRRGAVAGKFAWPAKYGTPPWTLARELNRLRQARYFSTAVDDASERGWTIMQWVAHATSAGVPVPLYTGGDSGGGVGAMVPRHVVLAIPGNPLTPDGQPQLSIYDPSSGLVHEVPLLLLVNRKEPAPYLGNWSHVVWAVLPDVLSD